MKRKRYLHGVVVQGRNRKYHASVIKIRAGQDIFRDFLQYEDITSGYIYSSISDAKRAAYMHNYYLAAVGNHDTEHYGDINGK